MEELRGVRRFRVTASDGLCGGILVLALVIRFAVIWHYGLQLTLHSDDQGYTDSARWLLTRGVYSYYTPEHPTLHMMPGITLLLAGVFSVFGTGAAGVVAAKVVMSCIGVVGIWGLYLTARTAFRPWVGVVAALLAAVYIPGVETDVLLLTETPFFAASMFLLYFLVRAGREHRPLHLYLATLFYVVCLYFRPTISAYLVVAWAYLLVRRFPPRKLLRHGVLSVVMVALLLSPWWVRNEWTFHHFVPLTDGTGNPLLLGTFQGQHYPPPGNADLEITLLKAQHPDLRPTADHEVPWMTLQTQVAKQRMKAWYAENPRAFLHAYLVFKPILLWSKPFYTLKILHLSPKLVLAWHRVALWAGFIGWLVALAFGRKRRWTTLLVLATFLYYTALYSVYFVYSRYSEPLMPLVMLGLPVGVWALSAGFTGQRRDRSEAPPATAPREV
ncbi:MAG: glycosyltransferase family 39 protein [Alicyclobacillus sp.]|nr:glycosyltransferase family 39 protein [Alicyclobacillus sp.]